MATDIHRRNASFVDRNGWAVDITELIIRFGMDKITTCKQSRYVLEWRIPKLMATDIHRRNASFVDRNGWAVDITELIIRFGMDKITT